MYHTTPPRSLSCVRNRCRIRAQVWAVASTASALPALARRSLVDTPVLPVTPSLGIWDERQDAANCHLNTGQQKDGHGHIAEW